MSGWMYANTQLRSAALALSLSFAVPAEDVPDMNFT
jgi:hypothetical protein